MTVNVDESTDIIVVEVEVPAVTATVVNETGPEGEPGEQGNDGWSPVFANVADGERRVLMVASWVGGTGELPPIGKFVGASGFVDNIAQAVNVRGATGAQGQKGDQGDPGAVIIGEGADVLTGDGVPSDDIGAEDQLYLDNLTGDLYKKLSGHWEFQTSLKGPQGDKGDDGEQGIDGAQGLDGPPGWSPVLAAVVDGTRRVLQVIDWTGGAGAKPVVGRYVGATGLVVNIADAIDVRGPAGAKGDPGSQGLRGPDGPQGTAGAPGSNGWMPILASVADGARRVFQVVDWQGGTGAKPATGLYLGVTGLVTNIADATDVRGAAGAQGPKGDDGADGAPGAPGTPGADGADGATFDPRGEWSAATTYAAHSLVSENGSSYTNGAPSTNQRPSTTPAVWTLVAEKGPQGSQGAPGTNGSDGAPGTPGTAGTDGTNGWSPVLAVIADGERRVLQVSDWVGGSGTKPVVGQYVGATGLTSNIANAVDIRGAQGIQGIQGEKGDQGIQGPKGDPGTGGGAASITRASFTYDGTSTVDSDPGAGKFRTSFTSRTSMPSSITFYVSNFDNTTADVSSIFDGISAAELFKQTFLSLFTILNSVAILSGNVSAIVKATNYYKITIDISTSGPQGTSIIFDGSNCTFQIELDSVMKTSTMPAISTIANDRMFSVPPGILLTRKSTLALTQNRMYVVPAMFKEAWRITGANIQVTTAGTGTNNVRFLVYRGSQVYFNKIVGGALLADSGIQSPLTSTGFKSLAIGAQPRFPPGLYLLCLAIATFGGAPVIQTLDGLAQDSFNVLRDFTFVDSFYVNANKATTPDNPWPYASALVNNTAVAVPDTDGPLYRVPFTLDAGWVR